MSRFLPEKIQPYAVKFRAELFRNLKFLTLKPSNWLKYLKLIHKKPRTFDIRSAAQSQYKIACILDEFSFESFKPEADFYQLDSAFWKRELETFKPDLILIESAWRGKNNSWYKKISYISNEIIELADWADQNGIPTVFWHKEVPPHFKTFMLASKLFDYIYLTDADCIDAYKKKVGRNRHVDYLSFAAQPKIHHPIQDHSRKHALIYAGSFYPAYRYPERHQNFMDIYDSLSPLIDFDIYDRMAGKGNYTFPEKFHPHIKGSLPFSEMSSAYRSYEYGLNMNSVKTSSTMCSRRVFELAACNTLVIGNSSLAVQNIFGDLTICSDDEGEILKQFQKLENDIHHKNNVRLQALRKVMSEYTYERNLEKILTTVSPNGRFNKKQVLIVSHCENQNQYNRTIENFNRQKYLNKHLIVLSDDKSIQFHPNILFCPPSEFSNNWADIKNNFEYVSIFNPQWFYDAYYLTDLIHGLKYGVADIATKAKTTEESYQITSTCIPYHSVFKADRSFDPNNLSNPIDAKCVAIDPFSLYKHISN